MAIRRSLRHRFESDWSLKAWGALPQPSAMIGDTMLIACLYVLLAILSGVMSIVLFRGAATVLLDPYALSGWGVAKL